MFAIQVSAVTPVSAPPPWHAERAAERARDALAAEAGPRAMRLSVALKRGPAYNATAISRLFAAVDGAMGPGVATRRVNGARHAALLATALTPLRPTAANDNEPLGITAHGLICLAGKRLDRRATPPLLEIGRHALARFVERSGRRDREGLMAGLLDATRAAEVVLATCAEGGAWLARGWAPVLLPAGEGAYLGSLRVLAGPGGSPCPVIEVHTWLHAFDLVGARREAWEILTARLPAAEATRHLPGALARLTPGLAGDRRVAQGVALVVPGLDPAPEVAHALRSSAPVLAARLALGLADPDEIAAELRFG